MTDKLDEVHALLRKKDPPTNKNWIKQIHYSPFSSGNFDDSRSKVEDFFLSEKLGVLSVFNSIVEQS